ncbi:DUF3376 domain-containing protein [Microbacteriaceae bacterium VKM Ac-2854]|nr:DUF3376 domain-containing protein [Microbacteriaceae bacterium VKM Ac-2854]
MTDILVRPLPTDEGAPGVRLELVGPGRSSVDDPRPRAFGHTLRFALAMRGGVSLAVWIGGAVAELDTLRRIRLVTDEDGGITALVPHAEATPPPGFEARATRYAELLAAAGYDRVEFDLLAGASAGGLNAVLYSVAQRSGATLDSLLGTWSTVGGFWNLLNGPRRASVDALMDGDGYFFPQAEAAARSIATDAAAHPDLVAEHVTVDLSATTIDGHDSTEQDAWEGRAHFHFVGDAARPDLGNGIPGRGDAGAGEALRRLAYAARSTSSLPGGFEPALIRSPADPEAASTALQPDMRRAFSGHRASADRPYRVVDGAVFDNVPIDRALEAARTRSSDAYASRALLFLDPDPDAAIGGDERWDPTLRRFGKAVLGFVSRSTRREATANEVDEVADFNGAMQSDAGHRDALGALIRSADWGEAARSARRGGYLRALASTDAALLVRALSRPSVWQLTSSVPQRERWRAVDADRLSGLRVAAVDHYDALSREAEPASLLRGPSALADAANCVLAWTRALERVPLEPGGRRLRDLGSVRGPAYRALQHAVQARQCATREVLRAAGADEGAQPTSQPSELTTWLTTWVRASTAPDLADLWDALDGCVASLRAESALVQRGIDAHDPGVRLRWRESPWAALSVAAAEVIPALDVVAAIAPSGVPPTVSNIRFWSIGVTQQPAQAAGFTALATAERRAVLGAELRRDEPRKLDAQGRPLREREVSTAGEIAGRVLVADKDVVLTPGGKLAGYGSGNFFGFLSADWRVGDWWWGRLDAAAGIVRFLRLAAPETAPTEQADREPGGATAAVQEEILREAATAELSPYDRDSPGFDPTASAVELRPRMRTGSDNVFNLSPAYRVALASRAVRILDRATRVHGKPLAATAREALLALLRPILVVLPAIADPPRAAVLAGFVGAAAWLLTWAESEQVTARLGVVPIGTAAVVAIGFTVSLWGALRSGRLRWRTIEDAVAAENAGEAQRIAQLRRESVRDARWAAVAAACSFVPLVVALIRFDPLLIILCLATCAGIVLFAKSLARAVPFEPVAGRQRRTVLCLSVVLLLGTGTPIVQLLAPEAAFPLDEWGKLGVMVVLGVALAVILTVDWLPIPRTRADWALTQGVCWPVVVLLATLAGLLAGIASWWIAGAFPPYWRDSLGVILYAVAWGNVVWWLPERRRTPIAIPDTLQRNPL